MHKEEIKNLTIELLNASKAYYVDDDPQMSDKTFDKKMDQLKKWEKEYPEYALEISPTKSVGSEPSNKFKKVKHSKPMQSINSSDNWDKIEHVCKKLLNEDDTVLIQPKMDGLSLEVVYKDGVLYKASTRGNGLIGEDVTNNIKFVKGIPQILPPSYPEKDIIIYGEIYMNTGDFHKINVNLIKENKDPFSNPRNAAAGSLRQKICSYTWTRPLYYFPFGITNYNKEFDHDSKALDQLIYEYEDLFDLGKVHELFGFASNIKEIKTAYNSYIENRDNLPFEIDGIVLKIDNYDIREKMQSTSKFPRWAYAIKFPPRKRTTILKDVVVQVGRTGKLTPVGILNPVDVQGVTVSRATLNNWDEISRLGISIGDEVEIIRAGDVIPKIIKRVGPGTMRKIILTPKVCPSCGKKVLRFSGVDYYCLNNKCPGKVLESISYFVSRDVMDIQSLGRKRIEQLIENQLVFSPLDLYTLKIDEYDLIKLPGWNRISTRKLLNEIESTIGCELYKVIMALGIPGIGKVNAIALAKKVKTVDGLINAQVRDIQSIDGFGSKLTNAVFKTLKNFNKLTYLKHLDTYINPAKYEDKTKSNILEGITVVFTGSLKSLTRSKAQELVKEHGGKATTSVSKNTNLLVCGKNAGSKKTLAEQLNIEIITEQEFIKRIGTE